MQVLSLVQTPAAPFLRFQAEASLLEGKNLISHQLAIHRKRRPQKLKQTTKPQKLKQITQPKATLKKLYLN